MQIEYALTFEEWREAYAPVTSSAKPATRMKPVYQLVSFLGLFFYAMYSASPFTKVYSGGVPRLENMWIMLTPSLFIITLFLGEMITKLLVARQTRGGKPLTQNGQHAAGMTALIAYIWVIPVWLGVFAIEWSPTDGQKIWTALAPWFLYLAVTRYISARRREGSWERLWANAPSFKRQNRATIASSGIDIDDGYAEHRYRWSYIRRYRETENMVVLTTIDTGTILLPKRAVPDDRSMDELKMLISENVAEGKFLQKQQAFPVIVTGPSVGGDSNARRV
jgi:hypothetical protein